MSQNAGTTAHQLSQCELSKIRNGGRHRTEGGEPEVWMSPPHLSKVWKWHFWLYFFKDQA